MGNTTPSHLYSGLQHAAALPTRDSVISAPIGTYKTSVTLYIDWHQFLMGLTLLVTGK